MKGPELALAAASRKVASVILFDKSCSVFHAISIGERVPSCQCFSELGF